MTILKAYLYWWQQNIVKYANTQWECHTTGSHSAPVKAQDQNWTELASQSLTAAKTTLRYAAKVNLAHKNQRNGTWPEEPVHISILGYCLLCW